ncbi:MAG: hypothetical protein O2865_03025 [Planctomycetota bacterium]|nr:hypothetical protein [Planctomycetota bacterium]MDA0934011.1 hypothetical protein [Planctomycetota bacterium]MDA1221826.1 hypothetical protein [Planctomycetota bacterium]
MLRLRGEDFGAHVRLAQIAYRFGDYSSWQRECAEARQIDPVRFAELGHPFELHDGRSHAERSARTDRGHEASRANLGRAAGVESGGVADIEGRAAGMVGLGGDDCSTEEERRRFERLGPIRAEQLAGLDVDELLRQFEA